MYKKALTILICCICTATLVFTGCGKKEKPADYGKVEDNVETVENVTIEGAPVKPIFKKQPTSLPYEWKTVDNGRANLRLPYPDGWKAETGTGYIMRFTAPDDDEVFPGMTVYFASTLEKTAIRTSDDIAYLVDPLTHKLKYTYDGLTVRPGKEATADEVIVDDEAADPNKQLQKTFRDWDVYTSGEMERGLYFQKTGFFWYNYPCTLTAITTNENADKLDDLLTYMFTNGTYITNTLGGAHMETVFKKSGLTVPIPNLYERADSDPGNVFEGAVTYFCPADSVTSYSQSALSIYETSAKKLERIGGTDASRLESVYLPIFMKNVFGLSPDTMDIQGGIESDDGYVILNGKKTQEIVYRFNMGYYATKLPSNTFVYQCWELDMYPIKHGKTVDILVLMSPQNVNEYAFDLIKLMAAKLEYKTDK